MIAEDFRSRQVHLMWLILFALSALIVGCISINAAEIVRNLLFNMMLLLYMCGGIFLWLRLRNRSRNDKSVHRIKDYIGAGDIVFVLALTPLFSLAEYLIFLLVAMVGSLLWWCIVRIKKRNNITIPFIGTAGVTFCLATIIRIL